MPLSAETDIGTLVAAEATKLVGTPSAPHGRFHRGVFTDEEREPQFYVDTEAEKHLRTWQAGNAPTGYTAHRHEIHLPESAQTGLSCSGLLNIVISEIIRILDLGVAVYPIGEFLSDCRSERGFSMDYSPPKMEWEKITVPRHVKGFYVWGLTAFVTNKPLRAGDILFTHTNGYRTMPSHVGIYAGERNVIHSPGIEGSVVEKVSFEEFTAPNNVPPFYGGLVAAKRLKMRLKV